MRNFLLFFLLVINATIGNAQSIGITPSTYSVPCGASCTNFSFKVPSYKSTESYKLDSVNFSPFVFNDPTAAQESILYTDDKFSGKINIPYKFCFYGNAYPNFVVGSNGMITFDSTNASCNNTYPITNTIPYAGGTQCGSISPAHYPKASIFASFTDLDPGAAFCPPDRSINWRVEGTSPFRKYIISYYNIGTFGTGNYSASGTNCNSLNPNTFQIVLYESTNYVDVILKNKACYATSPNGNRSISGIQDFTRTNAVFPAGKNATQWQVTNKHYRYIPTGTTPLLQSVTFERKDGTIIGTGTLNGLNSDSATVNYANYCITGNGPDTVVVRTNYNNDCLANISFENVDTIYVIKNTGDLLATATTTPATCLSADGSITVSLPTGAGTGPFNYSINGGALQASNTFTGLASGNYTIFVRDLGSPCTSTITVNVPFANPVTATTTNTPTTCPGSASGTLTVNALNTTPPVTYSLNGGTPQSSNIFTGLIDGTYNIVISDANGCNRSIFGVVSAGAGITATVTPTSTSCNGVADGSITITNPTGTAPHTYALDAGAYVSTNPFTGVAQGTHIIKVKDANGCIVTYNNIVVGIGAGITATVTPTATSCPGISNGSITVTNPTGTAPHTYSIGAGAYGVSNTFTGLAAGNYTINVKANNGCIVTYTNVSVTNGAGITASGVATSTNCVGVNNGTITVTTNNGQVPYSYQINAGTPQTSNVFNNLAASTYSIKVTDAAGCNVSFTITVNTGTGITATATTTATSCTGVNNGTITTTPTNGASPYTYSLDGGTAQSSNIHNNVSAGAHTVLVTDAVGCTRTINVTVAAGTGITATATTTATSCTGVNNGTITTTPTNGTSPYTYSLDGGTAQSSNIHNNVSAGAHTILVTDAVGCTRTINVTVAAGTGIAITFTATPATCAVASNGSATINAAGAIAPITYTLDGTIIQLNNNVFNNLTPGNHTITVLDGNGCTGSSNITIPTGSGISATNSTIATSCNNSANGSITITPTGGSTPYTYQLGIAPFQLSNTYNNLTANNYTVTVKDANGCTTTTNATVTAGPALSATTTITNVLCNGGNTASILVTNTNGTTPYTYTLNGGTPQSNNTFANLTAGTYTIALTDVNTCTGTLTAVVSEPAVLGINATATPVLCNGAATGTITISGTGGTGAYTYSIDNVSYVATNTFTVPANNYTVYIKDANGCANNANVTVTQPAILGISANTTNATCNGGADGTITATATGGTPTYTYSIDGTNFTTNANFNVLPNTYTVTVKDANGCTQSTTAIVGLTANILLNTRTDTTICQGQSVTLTTTSNGTTYNWLPSNSLNNATALSPVATPADTTTYIITATLGNCATTDTVVVQVIPAPIPDAGPGTSICLGKTYTLQGSGGTSYTWTPSTGLSNTNTPNPVASPTISTMYYLTVKSTTGCSSLVRDSVLVAITPTFIASAGVDTIIVVGQPYTLNATPLITSNIGNNSFVWMPAFGLNNPNIQSPIATITSEQRYFVDVITPEGCKATSSVLLSVYAGPTIYVPTGFTPNGDGVNDFFGIVAVGIKQFNYIKLYNRWGQVIYSSTNPKEKWNGTFKGAEQPVGTYVYETQGITDTGKVLNFKGTIQIIR